MKWFNDHLNWTYVISIIIALAILIPNFVTTDIENYGLKIFIGPIVAFLLNIATGIWILRKKGQSLWYLALVVVFYLALVVLALVLPNKRAGQGVGRKINELEYYKEREADTK